MVYSPGDGFRDASAQRLRQFACEQVLDAGMWTYLLSRVFRNLNWSPTFSLFQTLNHLFCGEPLEGWEPPTGWNGGQCPVFYDVYVEWFLQRLDGVPDPSNFRNAKVTVLGPIERIGFFLETDPNGVFSGYIGLVQGQPQAGLPDGTVRFAGVDPTFFEQPYFTTVEVVRLDGGPDNCNVQPPPPPRPPDADFNFPITWTGPGNIDITVDARASLGFAYFDNDLNLNLPFNLTIPVNVNNEFTVPFSFDFYFNFGSGDFVFRPPAPNDGGGDRPPGAPRPPQRPPSPDRDDPPPPPVQPGDDPPPVDPQTGERRMVAALVRAVAIENERRATEINQDAVPNIFAPNMGFVNFQIRLASGESAWTADIPVKNSNQLIPCPWEGGAVAVVANPAIGFDLAVTPLYAESDDFLDLFQRRI